MKNLYIDFDGVILDTITTSYRMLQERDIDPKDYEKATEFYRDLNWKSFLKEAEEINESFSNIKEIVESGLFKVSILTHIISLDEAEEKIKLLRRKIKNVDIIVVPKKIEKTQMVNPKNSILIDDYTPNLRKWKEAGGTGVRFSLKRNGKGFYAIDHLNQIIDLAQTINL